MHWMPEDTAPRCGRRFWGKVGDDAVAMFWHPEFKAFVSRFSRITLADGLTFDDGKRWKDHNPVVHEPAGWMEMPGIEETPTP